MAGLEGTKTDRQALTGDISVKHGLDGESVTIVKITESTEDGGTNIVEFSDGSTLKIKNGSGGKIGIDGKSAYQYAQDGGYTGTEEEFALLMSQENLQTEKVDKISIEVSKLSEEKANRIVETASGEVIVVTDSDEAKPLGLAIDGKSEQNQYSGANLINFENLAYSSGVAYTFKDDILVVVGDGKSGYQCVAHDVTNLFINNIGKNVSFGFEKITETVTGECSVELMLTDSDNKTTIFKLYDGSKKTSYVYTIPSNISSARFRIYTSNKNESNVVTNTVTIEKPMLYIGSEKTDYEPFTNLQPSPSPSYPQEIRNIGVYDEASGKYAVEVKCIGKNLINQLCKAGTSGAKFDDWLKAGIYTVSRDSSESEGNTWYLKANDENGVILTANAFLLSGYNPTAYNLSGNGEWYYGGSSKDSCTFELKEDCYVSFGSLNGSGNTYLQLEYGTVATDYEPYKETTATVYLDEPLRKGDKAYWNGGSKVRIDRCRVVEVFDGSDDEIWTKEYLNQEGKYSMFAIKLKSTNKFKPELCDKYVFKPIYSSNENIGFDASSLIGELRVRPEDYSSLTIEDWKACLAENPITVEYELAEPITEEIDLSLDGLSMFYPTTVISNDCNANMEVEYIADTKAYIDKKFAELATAML